jgi:hypothetical protein
MRRLLAIAGSLSLMACSATLRRPLRTTDAASDLAQVTRSRENEFDPAISPDARALAYEVAVTPEASPHVEVLVLDGAAPPEAGKVAYIARDVVGLEPAWLPEPACSSRRRPGARRAWWKSLASAPGTTCRS